MYYSAWGDPPMIERAQMDGSDRITLVEFTDFPYQRPTALAIDVDENVLYWVGDRDPSLQYIDLRYPRSEIVYHIDFSNYLHYPLGLALDAYYFYWTDWLLGNVIRAGRGPNPEVVRLIPYQYTPRGVNIYNPDDIQGKLAVWVMLSLSRYQQGRSQDFSKGGSHWIKQYRHGVFTMEYRRLFA